MKLVKLDADGLVRAFLGSAPTKPTGDVALVKIVLQVIRSVK